jgi:hypothetical protein
MVESHVLMKKNLSIPVLADEIQKKNTEAPVLAGASLLASLGFLCPGGGERWEKMGSVISNEYIYIYLFIYIDTFVYLSSYLSIYLYLIMWVKQSLKPPIW